MLAQPLESGPDELPTILIVDDTPANIHVLAATLREHYTIRIATNGPDALLLMQSAPVDMVLLDVMMPEMDGYEVCRRIKADPATSAIPVIFVTAVETLEGEVAGLKLGASDYLVKPVNLAIARQRIQNLIEREALRKTVERERALLEQRVAERTAELEAVAGTRERALQAAEHLSALKTQFINNMSHELRTPLNHILGMSHLCQRAKDLDKAKTYARRMEEAGERLLHMVNAVLDFSSVKLELAREKFDLHDEMSALGVKWRQRAAARGLGFEVDLPEEALAPLMGDPRRLRQAMDEILDNAVKFTESGSVGLRLRCDGEEIEITVSDSGVGMPPEVLAAGFKPFHQADGSATRRHGGMGLGLALTDYLVGLMGGSMRVESNAGNGTRVNLTFPAIHS